MLALTHHMLAVAAAVNLPDSISRNLESGTRDVFSDTDVSLQRTSIVKALNQSSLEANSAFRTTHQVLLVIPLSTVLAL